MVRSTCTSLIASNQATVSICAIYFMQSKFPFYNCLQLWYQVRGINREIVGFCIITWTLHHQMMWKNSIYLDCKPPRRNHFLIKYCCAKSSRPAIPSYTLLSPFLPWHGVLHCPRDEHRWSISVIYLIVNPTLLSVIGTKINGNFNTVVFQGVQQATGNTTLIESNVQEVLIVNQMHC